MDLKLIDKPSIILHKKYIHKLCIYNLLENYPDFEPTQSLDLSISNYHKDKLKTLIEYLNSLSNGKLLSEVTFEHWQKFESTEFEALTKVIFENLNIKVLELRDVNSKYLTPRFRDMIKNCKSLRSVEFHKIEDAHYYLDIIEANSHVKTWTIEFHDDRAIGSRVIKRLAQILSDRNDNSLFVKNDSNKLKNIPQVFKISPVAYC